MNSVIPRDPGWKRPAGDQPSPPAQATGVQPTRPKSLDTAAAALMRSSENPHAACRSKPSRRVTTVYGKYIGRVGALAVALGIGGAIATTPGVAWADDTASESNSSPAASTDESDSSADKSDTSNPSEITTTRESGATVRRSRGQHTSGTTGANSSTDDDTPAGTRSRQVRRPTATNSLTPSTRAGATALRPRSSGGTSVPTDGQAADQPNQPPTTTFTSRSSTSNAPQLIETAITPADTPTSKPAELIVVALGSLLAPGPQDPPESPALLAVLAWARRQSIRELADQTTAPSSMQTAQTAAVASPADGEVSPAGGESSRSIRAVRRRRAGNRGGSRRGAGRGATAGALGRR